MTGQQLRAWMARNGYTVQLLGAKMGVAERTVYRWRSSSRVPRYVELALEALEQQAPRAAPGNQAGLGRS